MNTPTGTPDRPWAGDPKLVAEVEAHTLDELGHDLRTLAARVRASRALGGEQFWTDPSTQSRLGAVHDVVTRRLRDRPADRDTILYEVFDAETRDAYSSCVAAGLDGRLPAERAADLARVSHTERREWVAEWAQLDAEYAEGFDDDRGNDLSVVEPSDDPLDRLPAGLMVAEEDLYRDGTPNWEHWTSELGRLHAAEAHRIAPSLAPSTEEIDAVVAERSIVGLAADEPTEALERAERALRGASPDRGKPVRHRVAERVRDAAAGLLPRAWVDQRRPGPHR